MCSLQANDLTPVLHYEGGIRTPKAGLNSTSIKSDGWNNWDELKFRVITSFMYSFIINGAYTKQISGKKKKTKLYARYSRC